MQLLDRHGVPLSLLVLRLLGGGGMLALHGVPKLLAFSEKAATFRDPLGVGSTASLALAIFAEVVCSVLLILGAFTRLAVVPLLVTMLVAAFVVHAADPWSKKELALLYVAIFLPLLLAGPGRWSVDARMSAGRARREGQ